MNGIIPFVTTAVEFIGEGFSDAWKKDIPYPVLKWTINHNSQQDTHRFIIRDGRGEEISIVYPNVYFKDVSFSRNLEQILS